MDKAKNLPPTKSTEFFPPAEKGFYIEATQNGIVRYDANSPNKPFKIEGLFTQGLIVCLCIIFHKNDKISLIHTDGNIHPQSIKNEHAWVGNGCNIYLFQKDGDISDRQKLIEKSGIPLETPCTQVPDEFVAIDINGKFHSKKELNAELIAPFPNKAYRHVNNQLKYLILPYINKVNKNLYEIAEPDIEKTNPPADLQFDGNDWTNLPEQHSDIVEFLAKFHNKENLEQDIDNAIKQHTVYRWLAVLIIDLSLDCRKKNPSLKIGNAREWAKNYIKGRLKSYINDYINQTEVAKQLTSFKHASQ